MSPRPEAPRREPACGLAKIRFAPLSLHDLIRSHTTGCTWVYQRLLCVVLERDQSVVYFWAKLLYYALMPSRTYSAVERSQLPPSAHIGWEALL